MRNNVGITPKIFLIISLLCLHISQRTLAIPKNTHNEDKIILCTFFTPSHEVLLNEWLLPSIQDDFEIIIDQAPQECPTASFMKKGWTKTTKKKVLHIIDTIKKNMGRIMIFADADIQFFGPIEPIIREMLKKNDFVIQKNNPQGQLCTGLFALNCDANNLDIWEKTYNYMLTHDQESDQSSFNLILHTQFENRITWSYLPTSSFMGGGTFTGGSWKVGKKLMVPDTILMHHANYLKGIKIKIAQLEYVKQIVKKRRLIPLHYVWVTKYAKDKRPSSFPYITGDSFRKYADHIIDHPYKSFDATQVKTGDTIFIYPYYLPVFFEKIHPQIREPYILLTHNSYQSIPTDNRFEIITSRHNLTLSSFARYLDDTKLISWFSKNAIGKHPKLFSIPIGIFNACWPAQGNIAIIEKIRDSKPLKKHLLCMNFLPTTDKNARESVYKFFKEKSFCYHPPQKPFDEYLQDMAESKFVLSPDGYGIECHRTWEAMYVGCIPIVKSGPLDHLYDDLPVLIVDDWNIITEKFLHRKYKEFQQRTYNLEKLYMPYWIEKIEHIKNEFLKNHLS